MNNKYLRIFFNYFVSGLRDAIVGGKFRDNSSDVPFCDTIVVCTFERLVKDDLLQYVEYRVMRIFGPEREREEGGGGREG